MEKKDLRRATLARRDAVPADAHAAAAEAVAAHTLPLAVRHGAMVAGYLPIRSELDPQPLMRRLVEAGARLALPVVTGRGEALTLRAFRFGAPLASGPWGVLEPTADAPEVAPDIVLVPLAAFDRTGHRIGYGAGFYDLTLARLRASQSLICIGIGFSVQEIQKVPATDRDARLDLVLTEREVIDCR